jgi:hypothetical protein
VNEGILKQLFDGELAPSEHIRCTDPQYHKISDELFIIKDSFFNTLSESDQKTTEKIDDLQCELYAMYNFECFKEGFRMGVTLILETLNFKLN